MGKGMQKKRLALVFGSLPLVEEIDQFQLLGDAYDVFVISSASICDYVEKTCHFNNLKCVALPDYDDNTTYLPGLEQALANFDVVIVKERLGMYAYQTVKAKWRNHFQLAVWVDNLTPFPADDVNSLSTIRREITDAADLFFVQSNAAAQVLRLEGVTSSRICMLKPWVEARALRKPTRKAKAHEVLGLHPNDFVIAHFGQLEFEENLLDLVHAVKLAMDTNSGFAKRARFLFCGIGTQFEIVQERLRQLELTGRAVFVAPSRDAYQLAIDAADALYLSTIPSRDRIEGDPYRMLLAMTNGIPLIAHRSQMIEEFVGKHRIDFCPNSLSSLQEALLKCYEAKSIVQDVVKKNLAVVAKSYSKDVAAASTLAALEMLQSAEASTDRHHIDRQVREIEAKVLAKQYLEAIDLIEATFKIEAIPSRHVANLLRLIGDCFAKLGDVDAAKEQYLRAAKEDPYFAKAFIGLGTVALTKGSFDIAVINFQKAVGLAPNDEMANHGLGLAFQGLTELTEANKWVSKALDINPDSTSALFTLTKIAYDHDDFTSAERALRVYTRRHPEDLAMLYSLGGVLFKMGRYLEVAECMYTITSIDPNDQRAVALATQATAALEKKSAAHLG